MILISIPDDRDFPQIQRKRVLAVSVGQAVPQRMGPSGGGGAL